MHLLDKTDVVAVNLKFPGRKRDGAKKESMKDKEKAGTTTGDFRVVRTRFKAKHGTGAACKPTAVAKANSPTEATEVAFSATIRNK